MFPSNLSTNFGPVSFLAVSLVLIYLYCYTRNFKNDDYAQEQSLAGKYAVYMITVTYAAYLMFSPFSYYRIATLVPFLYIVLVQNRSMVLYNGILEVAMQVALMLKLVLRGSILFVVEFVNKAPIQRFFGYSVKYKAKAVYAGIDNYIYKNNDLWEHYQPFFSGVAAACLVLLLVLNHPEKQINIKVNGDRNIRALLWARTLIIVPFVVMVLYLFAKYPDKIYY